MHFSAAVTLGERQIHSHDMINLGVSSAETQESLVPSQTVDSNQHIFLNTFKASRTAEYYVRADSCQRFEGFGITLER